MVQIRISDPKSLRWYVKGVKESSLGEDSMVQLMNHDPDDLGSLILIQDRTQPKALNL